MNDRRKATEALAEFIAFGGVKLSDLKRQLQSEQFRWMPFATRPKKPDQFDGGFSYFHEGDPDA